MAQFRGSARNSGFNAISLPDNARRIEQAGIKRIQDLRANYQQTIANQKEDLSDLQSARNAEFQQDAKNERLEDRFQSTYEKALEKRYKQKIKKQKDKADLEKSAYDRLGTFSQEALKVGKELYENHKDERKEAGMALVFKLGLDAEDLQNLRAKEDDLAAEHGAVNAVIQKLEANGASASEIQQIRELDGWALMGAQKEIARNTKLSYMTHMLSDKTRNKKYKLISGEEMSLAMAERSGTEDNYTEIRGMIAGEFLKPYSGYDLAFAEEYMFPGMRSVDTTLQADYASKQQKRYEKEENEKLDTSVSNVLAEAPSNPHALNNWLQGQSGGLGGDFLKNARVTFGETISRLVNAGVITNYDQLSSLRDQKITVAGKDTTFGEQFLTKGATATVFNNIRKQLDQKRFEEYQQSEREDAMTLKRVTKAVLEQYDGDGLSAEEKAAALKELGHIQPDSLLTDIFVNRSTGYDRKAAYRMAVAKVGAGVDYTDASLAAEFPQLSKEQRTNLLVANNVSHNGETGFKGYTNSLAALIKTTMGDTNLLTPGFQATRMVAIMEQRFAQDFYEKRQDKQFERHTDSQLAQEIFRTHMNGLNDPETKGLYQRITTVDTKGNPIPTTGTAAGFVAVGKEPEINKKEFDLFDSSFRDIPNVINTTQLFGDINDPNSWASDLSTIARTGKPTPWLEVISRSTGQAWKVIYNSQARLYDMDLLPLGRMDDAAQGISPGFRKSLMGKYTTPAGILTASAAYTRSAGAGGIEVYRPLLNLMATYESSNDTVHDGYDAMNLYGTHGGDVAHGSNTGTIHFGAPLIGMKVGDIMYRQSLPLSDPQGMHAAGRYQFVGDTLKDGFERGWVPGNITKDTLFDKNTQDQLAIAYIRSTIRDFPNDPVGGIMGRWNGIKNNVSHAQLTEIVKEIQANPRIQAVFKNTEIEPTVYARYSSRSK